MSQEESQLEKYQVKIEDYSNDQIPERRWAIVYVGGKTFFLTDEERAQLLTDLKKGATIIQVGLLTLTNRFSYMYATKEKPFKRQFKEVEKNGVVVMEELN